MSSSYVMKLSTNGQVSLPADTRSRWQTRYLLVVDLGDRVVMRPVVDEPIRALVGKHRGGPSADEARREARRADEASERRRRG